MTSSPEKSGNERPAETALRPKDLAAINAVLQQAGADNVTGKREYSIAYLTYHAAFADYLLRFVTVSIAGVALVFSTIAVVFTGNELAFWLMLMAAITFLVYLLMTVLVGAMLRAHEAAKAVVTDRYARDNQQARRSKQSRRWLPLRKRSAGRD